MEKIKIMINGIPGNVATTIAKHIIKKNIINNTEFELIPFSLTGMDIEHTTQTIGDTEITLIKPDQRDEEIKKIKNSFHNFISIDFTHPSAVNSNAQFYIKNSLPFVMGTTGGDREKLKQNVLAGEIPAVIAPNMAKQIVGFQAMMEYAANTFPDLFKGYNLKIEESHQKGKADTSGTAKAMVKYFNRLGIPFSEKDIIKERDPERQKNIWKIPEEYLSGHGWHTYTLVSDDKTVKFEFKHNINGRDIYVNGTMDGVIFLNNKLNDKTSENYGKGRVYTMIDVLKNTR